MATGIRNVMGNKGGVAVSMCVDGVSIAFVNAHLAAHQHNILGRNRDYHRICKEMFAPPTRSSRLSLNLRCRNYSYIDYRYWF